MTILADPEAVQTAAEPTYPTVTICGSTRFFEPMLLVADELERQGNIVLLPLVRTRVERPHLNATAVTTAQLDAQHREKIARADRIVIVTDWQYYIGDSTSNELALSQTLGKPVTYARVRTRNMCEEIVWSDPEEVPAR